MVENASKSTESMYRSSPIIENRSTKKDNKRIVCKSVRMIVRPNIDISAQVHPLVHDNFIPSKSLAAVFPTPCTPYHQTQYPFKSHQTPCKPRKDTKINPSIVITIAGNPPTSSSSHPPRRSIYEHESQSSHTSPWPRAGPVYARVRPRPRRRLRGNARDLSAILSSVGYSFYSPEDERKRERERQAE
jgi:hypothetical protein